MPKGVNGEWLEKTQKKKAVKEREFFVRHATAILDIMDGCDSHKIDAVLHIIAKIGHELIW